MLPILLDLTDRTVLVVGGGPVGQRKARTALLAGGRVRLVCLEPPCQAMSDDRLSWLCEPYECQHLNGVDLVFAAATPEVNVQVVADARRAGIWASSATAPSQSDFHLPAVWQQGKVLLAVSTTGAAPGLAGLLRDRLAEQIDEAVVAWIDLLAELRPMILAGVAEQDRRRTLFGQLCQWSYVEQIREEGVAEIRQRLRNWLALEGITGPDGPSSLLEGSNRP